MTSTSSTFSDLHIDADLVEALASRGITKPFPIQEQAIPLAVQGQDVIGQAKTGTGKTLGFGLPILQQLGTPPEPGVQALIVVPTRELAQQVHEDLIAASSGRAVKIAAIYGGKAYEGQIEAIKNGAQIVVGTPGRLLDLVHQHELSFASVRIMVLDEADKMLDLGFLPDVERIFDLVPAERQTMLFSATMPGPVVALSRRFMRRPVHIQVSDPDEGRIQANIKHFVYRAHPLDKDEIIGRILQARGRGRTIIFTRTKRAAARLADELTERGFKATAVHGDLNQEQREKHLDAFRAGTADVLVATDVAARGIDVDDVTHVINHSIPEDEKDYLHRVGRTGRAGKTGIAVTFVDWQDVTRWSLIDQALDFGQPEPTETYSTSPHLFTDLDISEKATGRLVPKRPSSHERDGKERNGDERGRRGKARKGRGHDDRSERQEQPSHGRGGQRRGGRGRGRGHQQDASVTSLSRSETQPAEGAPRQPRSADSENSSRPRRRRQRAEPSAD